MTLARLALALIGSLGPLAAPDLASPSASPGRARPKRISAQETDGPRLGAIELSRDDVRGWFRVDANHRLRFCWTREGSSDAEVRSWSSERGAWSTQFEPVEMRLTESCGFGVDRVCIAGVTARGTTRIELWTLDASATLAEPPTEASGAPRAPEIRIAIASRTTLFDGVPGDPDETGGTKRPVRALFRNHGARDSLFVQLEGNGDLLRFDTIEKTWSTAMKVDDEPLLEREFDDRWSAHHTIGYFYAFGFASGEILMLVDEDLDGTLDRRATRRLSAAEWACGPVDFSDATGYVERY